jgi:gas vesicle protein
MIYAIIGFVIGAFVAWAVVFLQQFSGKTASETVRQELDELRKIAESKQQQTK